MNESKFPTGLMAGIVVALFLIVALVIRIVLPYDQVFTGDWIKFTGTDASFHMRIVDNLVHNFPKLNSFDPYLLFPGGMGVDSAHRFFDYLLAGIIWLIGLGSPSQHTVDVIGVYFPAVLGALTVIPVYFIGKELFNRLAGVIAAGLIAISPGEFLGRSILGRADHHSAEVLFTTIAMLFFILAMKIARQRQFTYNHLRYWDGAIVIRPLVYSLLAGIFLGMYLLTWSGGLLFIFILFVYFVIQFMIDHLRGQDTTYLCLIGVIVFLIALAVSLPFPHRASYLAALVIALLTPPVLSVISRLMSDRASKPVYFPLTLVGLGLIGLAGLYFINPSLLKSIVAMFGWINPTGAGLTTIEAQRLLFPGGQFSLSVAWGNFNTGLFLSLAAVGILVYFIVKKGEADKTLLVIWSLIILIVTLSMRRFAYYYAVNVALLTGYFSWLILYFAGFKKSTVEKAEVPVKVKKKARRKKDRRIDSGSIAGNWGIAIGAIIVFFLSFFPNFELAIKSPAVVHAAYAPSDAWCESLYWMRDNTPEPFGDAEYYYGIYEPRRPGENYSYPDTAYGVAAWWDYGYWIVRQGKRIPNCNPGGGNRRKIAEYFIAQDEASADKIAHKLNSKYVIIDYDTAVVDLYSNKYYAIATYGGSSMEEFFDVYVQRQDGKTVIDYLFYPEYYRSLAVRLYNFNGEKVVPERTTVISYEDKVSLEGVPYKEITSSKSFPGYKQAASYVAEQGSARYRIVSNDPFTSPVPLEPLEHYKLIYSSGDSKVRPGSGKVPLVKIFEFRLVSVDTVTAEKITDSSATLVGSLGDLGGSDKVSVSFLYGTSEGCKDGETSPKIVDSKGSFELTVSDLSPNTTYYYKAKAAGEQISYGKVKSFITTGPAPTIDSLRAGDITDTSAVLKGDLIDLGTAAEVTVSFVYGTTRACNDGETSKQVKNAKGLFEINLSNLLPNTTYYYRAKAVGDGESYSRMRRTFTTTGPAPTVFTLRASDITDTTAVVNGELSDLGTAQEVTVSFVYGTTSSCTDGETTTELRNSTGFFSIRLSDLSPSSTYYYKARASGNGDSYGEVLRLTTH